MYIACFKILPPPPVHTILLWSRFLRCCYVGIVVLVRICQIPNSRYYELRHTYNIGLRLVLSLGIPTTLCLYSALWSVRFASIVYTLYTAMTKVVKGLSTVHWTRETSETSRIHSDKSLFRKRTITSWIRDNNISIFGRHRGGGNLSDRGRRVATTYVRCSCSISVWVIDNAHAHCLLASATIGP